MPNVRGAPWFIAFPIPAGDWYTHIRSVKPENARFLHPEDLHLTAVYLGRCGEAAARAAMQTIADLRPAWPQEITLEELRAMGPPRCPSAYSAVVGAGRAPLQELLAACHAALHVPQHAGGHIPHVTLLRPPRKITDEARAALTQWATSRPALAQPVTLDSMSLYTWDDSDTARRYQTPIQIERR